LDSSSVFSVDPVETIASDRAIIRRCRPWFYLRLARRRRGLSLVLVIQGGLWLGECLGELPARRTSLAETSLEPSARIGVEHRGGRPHS
jgi:hypothetical protein